MITNKLISHGLKKSGHKIKTSKSIGRLCNISEKTTPYEKMFNKEVNQVSLKASNKHVKEVNRKYKRTGKKITKTQKHLIKLSYLRHIIICLQKVSRRWLNLWGKK